MRIVNQTSQVRPGLYFGHLSVRGSSLCQYVARAPAITHITLLSQSAGAGVRSLYTCNIQTFQKPPTTVYHQFTFVKVKLLLLYLQ